MCASVFLRSVDERMGSSVAKYSFDQPTFRIRLWVDERPNLPSFPHVQVGGITSFAGGKGNPRHSSATIEYFRPRGGMYEYGLLGADFCVDDSDVVQVRIPASARGPSATWDASLNKFEGDIVCAFSQEYTPAIVDGIRRCDSELPCGGLLTVTAMVHSYVGSSATVFQSLAKGVVRLFSYDGTIGSVEEAKTLMD